MNIGDLGYLENALSASSIRGSAAPNQVSLNLNGSSLVLIVGETELYRTTLSGVPSSTQLVFENLPGTKVTISTKNVDGTVTSSSSVTTTIGQSVPPISINTFLSRFLPLF